MAEALSVYISYAEADKAHRDDLVKFLAPLMRAKLINEGHKQEILAGDYVEAEAQRRIDNAHLVLLLLTSTYLEQDECHKQKEYAIGRVDKGAQVIPVIVEPCLLESDPLLVKLKMSPTNAKPVTLWTNQEEAWADVARGVETAVKNILPVSNSGLGEKIPLAPLPHETPTPVISSAEMQKNLIAMNSLMKKRRDLLKQNANTSELDREIKNLKGRFLKGGQPAAGSLLGNNRYKLLRALGEGRFGVVWEAQDLNEQKLVAIKVLNPRYTQKIEDLARFQRGVEAMKALGGPNVVRVIDTGGEDNGFHYYVMELLGGGDLQWSIDQGLIPPERMLDIVVKIGRTLGRAHANSIIHRDVKPANIVLDKQGTPYLTDFDLAGGLLRTGFTDTETAGGGIYGSPEIRRSVKNADARSDVYSLGVIAIRGLLGRELQSVEIQIPQKAVVQLDCGDKLKEVLAKAVAADQMHRYDNADAFVNAIEEAMRLDQLAKTSAAPEHFMPAPQGVGGHRQNEPQIYDAPPPIVPRHESQLPIWTAIGWIALIVFAGLAVVFFVAIARCSTSSDETPAVASHANPPPESRASAASPEPPSCVELPKICGPKSNEDCCASIPVPAGEFNRGNDRKYPAQVGDFRLDRFEISVGRFRKFVNQYPASKPKPAAGAHPSINESGWNPVWNGELPEDQGALKEALRCDVWATWDDTSSNHENNPINCINWYMAFAFCAWDGGHLPTETEWNYVAAGGNEQREYPWFDAAKPKYIDREYAVYSCFGDGNNHEYCEKKDILTVGSRSKKGDSKWGHADMAGNMNEWTADAFANYSVPCLNCANLNGQYRVTRGGSWWSTRIGELMSHERRKYSPVTREPTIGARCARKP